MAQILNMGQYLAKFCVARLHNDKPQFLMLRKGVFVWDNDILNSMIFAKESDAKDMAARVANGAQAVEMIGIDDDVESN